MQLNWGHAIAAVYTTFALATLSFVAFAIQHPAELVSQTYYADSLLHDQHAEAAARGAGLGDRVFVELDEGNRLVFGVPTNSTDTVQGQATLYRASNANADRTWPIALDGSGRQAVVTSGLPSGHWTLRLDWRAGGVDFYAERAVTLP
jgi:hypothetical protein